MDYPRVGPNSGLGNAAIGIHTSADGCFQTWLGLRSLPYIRPWSGRLAEGPASVPRWSDTTGFAELVRRQLCCDLDTQGGSNDRSVYQARWLFAPVICVTIGLFVLGAAAA